MVHFFFQRDAHTHKRLQAFLRCLVIGNKRGNGTFSERVRQAAERNKTKKNCKVMVITCAIVCIHNVCVCVWRGTTLQYRGKGRDSGGAYGYTAKKQLFLGHRPLWRWEDVTWQCSIKNWCRFSFYLERKKWGRGGVMFLFLPRGTTASLSTRKKSTHEHTSETNDDIVKANL